LTVRAALLLVALLGIAACTSMSAQRPSTALLNVQVLTERLALPGLNRERTLRLYLPPSYATHPDRRYPVIYMHDGQNLFDDASSNTGEWGVDETLNELAARTGFEAIVVGIDHGGDKRGNELIPWSHAPGRRRG
jgi:predicted alpha/beta superfamily hydrolase